MKRKISRKYKVGLRKIEKEEKQPKNTVKSLLNFIKTSPGWVGDDFEECLEYVNEVRRQ